MGLLDRLLLTVYTVALMVFSALTVVVTAGATAPFHALQVALLNPEGRLITGIISFLVLVSSVRLLYSAFRPLRMRVVHETELGEVSIAREAVENLVQRVSKQVRGVREVRPHVTLGPGGIEAELRVWVNPDVNVPELAAQLQVEVRRAMHDVVGVELTAMSVRVENIGADGRRVRIE